jgi:hypothetical protein
VTEDKQVPSDFELGLLAGILIGEGHFGGDGRQPQVTLKMHVRHEALFRWLERTFPGGKLYGPYHYDGRHFYQWMARGAYLRDYLLPLLEGLLGPELDEHSFKRLCQMRESYASFLGSRRLTSSATSDESLAIDGQAPA